MVRRFDYLFQTEVVTINPGEYLASNEDIAIGTILGSCVSVAFWDEKLAIGGLNHFMLAQSLSKPNEIEGNVARYGEFAMEKLINDLMKMGSTRKSLVSKVFGGGSVLRSETGIENKIPWDNVNFTLDYLKGEGIPVLAQDVGGTWPRKIFFFPKTNRVLLKHVKKETEKVLQEEKSYLKKTEKEVAAKEFGDIVWFK